jgi:hypothetical protein
VRPARLVPLGLVAIAVSLGCQSFTTTSTPICGGHVLPDGVPCTPFPDSCGCPAGQRCGIVSKSLACEAPGTVQTDQPCTSDEVCAAGTLCDGTRCRQTCWEALDCGDDAASACVSFQIAQGAPSVSTCERACDPTSPSQPFDASLEACGQGETCVPFSPVPQCELATGTAGVGETCQVVTDCQPGLECLTSSNTGTCMQACFVEAPSACAAPKTCSAISANGNPLVIAGRYTLGACQ